MAPKPDFNKTPQEVVHDFWDKYFTKKPGSLYASLLLDTDPRGSSSSRNAVQSYEAAAKECCEKAHRTNEKFTDLDFNIERDRGGLENCLKGLIRPEKDDDSGPGSVHRVDWIFDEPKFTKDGYSSSNLRQGKIGNCWWIAAVTTIANRQDLMNKICVARDEQAGVYGFVFYRDGDWFSVIVDDFLYLRSRDFDHGSYDPTDKYAREYKERHQTGSVALHFADCLDPNETWLPLLEKAYAKAHGDYEALHGGWPSEAVEDMTGGVGTEVKVNTILNKDKFWEQLVNVDGDFVFTCTCTEDDVAHDHKGGMPTGHAYSILKATEEVDKDGNKVRLVLIRNPWDKRSIRDGRGEWNGPWSDGSKERTPYWLKRLGHTFGDNGTFWMTYQDMVRVVDSIDRTRLFDEKWTVVQQWTSIHVGWIAGYHNTKFILEVKKAGMVVVVLSQASMIFRKEGEVEHICRATNLRHGCSVNCEIELEAGRYEVLPKIAAIRDSDKKTVEDIVRKYADHNPAKLRQVGMQYDLAHAKGGVPDEDHILTRKKERKKRKEQERCNQNAREMAQLGSRVFTTTTVTNGRVETNTQYFEAVAREAHKCETVPATGDTDSKDGLKGDDKLEDAVGNVTDSNDDKDDKAGDVKPEQVGDDKKEGKTDDGKPEVAEDDKQEEKTGDVKLEVAEDDKQEEKTGVVRPEDAKDDKEDNTDVAKPEDAPTDGKEEGEEKKYPEGHVPWNAVCVVGLLVYSQGLEVTVTLAETKNMEEGACLVVDSHAVGPTMARL
ncbi:calpain-9 [Rhypophila decipiens]